MPISTSLPRRTGEALPCGSRSAPGASRAHALFLAAATALAAAAAPNLLASGEARAQSSPEIPPELQQPLPVQPGQPPAQQQPPQQPAPQSQPGTAAAPPAGQSHGDWMQLCTTEPPPGASQPDPGKEACFLVQTATNQETGRPLLKVTVGFFGPQRRVAAVIATPLGVQLTRGLQVSVDGREIDTVPFQICEANGCQAVLPMDAPVVDAFKAGSMAEALVEVRGRDHPLPISLKGFTAGFTAIQ